MDKLASNSAEKGLLRHLWYIALEMIPLSFLSSVVSSTEKELQENFYCVNHLNLRFVHPAPVLVQALKNLTFFSMWISLRH